MKILWILAAILLLVALGGCASRRGYRFEAAETPPEILVEIEQIPSVWSMSELSISTYRIAAADSPFDGETITMARNGCHGLLFFIGFIYNYSVTARFSPAIVTSFDLGFHFNGNRMFVKNMRELGFSRAASRFETQTLVEWHGAPNILSDYEIQHLGYLFTVFILNFGLENLHRFGLNGWPRRVSLILTIPGIVLNRMKKHAKEGEIERPKLNKIYGIYMWLLGIIVILGVIGLWRFLCQF